MTFQEIQELIKLLSKSNLAEFKMKDGEFELSIRTGLYKETRGAQFASAAPVVHAPVVSPPMIAPAPVAAAAPHGEAEKEKPAEAPAKKEVPGKYLEIKSPMVGTFYRSPSPEKPVYAEIGQKVKKGDVVCIIEAMKLFNEIESEVSGTIVKVLVENSKPVEYEQALFLVEPD
ncbi:MAG: acetyl-CoA carboxylase biotin carboxyl carrier protein [Bacteroidota bacterium]